MMTVVMDVAGKSNRWDAAGRRVERAESPGSVAAADLVASGALDDLFAKIDAGTIDLTGDGGFVPGLIKAALERGLQVELASHLGYEKGDPGGSGGGVVPELAQRHDPENDRVAGRRCRFGGAAGQARHVRAATRPQGRQAASTR